MEGGDNMFVRVLYNFDYTTKDGRLVSIRQGEKLLLLKHTNQDWWQVLRNPESKPFYVPAAYVRECPPAYIPGPEYLNIASSVCCHDERRQLTSVLRNELITGNYNLRDKHQLFNQHVCSADKGPTGESKKSAVGVRRNYSVVGPGGKKPVPSPRINVLSKSLETLAEEINFKPWNTPISSSKVIEQTSDYNTPSPDYLDSSESDMFWRKNTAAAGSSVQRSSSFKFRSFRRDNNEQPARQDDSDSVASRSLESLVDSGAEACSSSSYEWDKSPDENRELLRRISIPHAALAFKNQTYHSTDDEGSDGEHTVVRGRPRSSSDTGLGVGGQQEKRGTQLSRSESHKEQPRPLAALKRNQKVVGCRRRPAILCIPSKNSSNSLDDDDDDEVPPFNVAPRPLQHQQPLDPPTPDSREKPQRVLPGGWSEFRTENGRAYYFHSITGIKSWKPPRTRIVGNNREHEDTRQNEPRSSHRSPKEGTKSRSPSPAAVELVLPPGWDEYYDRDERQAFYIHKPTGAKWFSSSDNEGRLYFFAENSNESSWSLPQSPAAPKSAPPPPETAPPPRTSTPLARVAPQGVPPVLKKLELQLQQAADDLSPTDETEPLRRPRKNMGPCLLPPLPNSRASKSQSMIVVPDVKTPMSESQTDAPSSPGPWASLESSGATILKEGQITRTKVMESKKKVKKNWSPAWALLTSDCMYFFKDEKSFKAMKNSTGGHPELCVPLNQSCFQEGDKNLSSKKNTFLIGTDTNQVLCQEEQIRDKESWFNQISLAKKCMPENHLNTAPRYPVLSRESSPLPPAVGGPPVGSVSPEMSKNNSLNRNKSVKIKKDSAESNEDLSTENHTKIKAGLRKFFKRRPTMESLVKKGIIQDEPAFGSTLSKLCQSQSPGSNGYIPKFVLECINAIEKKPENLKTDGIYRASGNLSQVQKIRLQVDQNNLAVLDQEEEVHVLTGALKLFFRELKEPLIPFGLLDAALTASNNRDKSEKIRQFRGLVQQMPKENRATLKFLLEHLLRVVDNHTHNRMHISNLAIVFGPTLMWPKEESCNMALELMQQNYVIECLLEEFDSIFN
ncbi:rho GTPase-activating protein 12-like isoform X4 [Cloeon dipterum]|uniref:rho GTPase-activating protein 12-like isoform X4 n=1 Tax=Cloeon dipterum TaxID=197152 RepID=UPI00321FBF5F